MMQIVIDIPEKFYEYCKAREDAIEIQLAVKNGIPLPKGHGDLIDRNKLCYDYEYNSYDWETTIEYADAIIEANTKYEAKAITRGNCMMCGKELTEGLFFCKECEDKVYHLQ